jgi:Ca2+:H+ antiporter
MELFIRFLFILVSTKISSSLLTIAVVTVLLPAAFHFSVNQSNIGNNQPLADTQQGRDILSMSRGVREC